MLKKAAVAGVVGVVAIAAAFAMGPPLGAQTRDRDVTPGIFMSLGRAAEIGVSVRELTADEVARVKLERPGGVFLVSVRDGSPAARAGLRGGDIIATFDGERVRGVRHFTRLLQETPPGRAVQAEIVRDGARQTIAITPEATEGVAGLLPEIRREIERGLRTLPRDLEIEPFPQRGPRARLGVTLAPLTDQLASYFGVTDGVLVSAVQAGSPAAQAGLRAGDVITAIEGRTMHSPGDVAASVRMPARGSTLDVRLVRDRKEMSVKVTIADGQPAPARLRV
ncbi:MAG: PDZ domain-containing protein [Acidobacteria bacterium]|nr:PDZ domain-containing protein [Acidobacteriota bacterium]